MEEKNIYLFLDWSQTINELIPDDAVVKCKLDKFINAINQLETVAEAKVKFIIVSGTKQSSAQKRYNILNQALRNIGKEDVFLGFAFEYGAYFIDQTNRIIKMVDATLSSKQWSKIKEITSSFNFDIDKEFKSYFNIEFDSFNDKTSSFIDCCKKNLPELDFEIYDDKYGHGVDVKNFLLNKGAFVELYLKRFTKSPPYMIIAGGDSTQDIKMISQSFNCKKYFIGFYHNQKKLNPSAIISTKENIDGIVDGIEKITNELNEKLNKTKIIKN